jgi:hypothetical protein
MIRFLAAILPLVSSLALSAAAQPADAPTPPTPTPGDSPSHDQNKRLKINLDRTTIHAFEPLYLCLTAEQFAAPEVKVSLRRPKEEKFTDLAIQDKEWSKSEASGGLLQPMVQRRGVILQAEDINGVARWLFTAPGEYKLRVSVGIDSVPLTVTVLPSDSSEAERQAWEYLADRRNDVLNNEFSDSPDQGTINHCAGVLKKYPRSLCAAYCQSYLSISKFKILFDKNAKSGGKAVYGDMAEELRKVADAFKESFFGEMTGFYAAYAMGLAKDFDGLIKLSENVQTHMTIWSDGLIAMKLEVLSHIGPRAIPIDPGQPIPTTGPTTLPTIRIQ